MREILFRGKTHGGEWEYGVPVFTGLNNELAFMKQMHSYDHQVIPETVGQFAGLTDKNGKKAFEHDVIQHHFGDEIGVIRYGEYRNPFGDDNFGGHVGFYVDWASGKNPELLRKDLGYWMNIVEILGNIHDNPELLEEN